MFRSKSITLKHDIRYYYYLRNAVKTEKGNWVRAIYLSSSSPFFIDFFLPNVCNQNEKWEKRLIYLLSYHPIIFPKPQYLQTRSGINNMKGRWALSSFNNNLMTLCWTLCVSKECIYSTWRDVTASSSAHPGFVSVILLVLRQEMSTFLALSTLPLFTFIKSNHKLRRRRRQWWNIAVTLTLYPSNERRLCEWEYFMCRAHHVNMPWTSKTHDT